MANTCLRTHRLCEGGAFDGGDGWGIDCPGANPETCPHRLKITVYKKCRHPFLYRGDYDISPAK